MTNPHGLVRPGLLGRAIRIVMAGLVAWLAVGTWQTRDLFWTGDLGSVVTSMGIGLAVSVFLWNWVVGELFARDWGWRPLLATVAAGLVATLTGSIFGTWQVALGVFLWSWLMAFAVLLAPAFLLAGLLGQPGCEMRVYAASIARLRGQDAAGRMCPGGIDMFDHIGSPDLKG